MFHDRLILIQKKRLDKWLLKVEHALLILDLIKEISIVPSSRLLSLLGQVLHYQKEQGLIPNDAIAYDLFRGKALSEEQTMDKAPYSCYQKIKVCFF